MNKIIKGVALLAISAVLFGCKQEYTPLENQAYIAQTNMQAYQSVKTLVHNEPVFSKFNVRLSHPASSAQTFTIVMDDSVIEAYNTRTGNSLVPMPKEYYSIPETNITIDEGSVVSNDINIKIEAPSQEMKDSGKSYAIGVRIEGTSELTKGADRLVIVVDQPAIQDVVQFNSRSNIQLRLNDEMPLTNWTVEYFVNMDRLGTGIGDLNNQALFAVWGSGTEVDGVVRSGEIYTRFGDAPIEGNRFQVKTKGTQINSKALFDVNTWYHIAIVCSDTKLELYIDGELDNTLELNPGPVWINKDLNLGNTSHLRANVKMAQLRIWNVARTQNQIKNSMTRVDATTEGLVAYWRFNEGEGDVFKDATGKHPDATTKRGNVTWIKDVQLD